MRESIGATWLFQLIIIFMLLFVAYLTVMINYSTAFKSKNEVLSIIEKYEGLQSGVGNSVGIINTYLANSGYNATGECSCADEANCYGASTLTTPQMIKARKNTKYYWCAEYESTGNAYGYYNIELFLKFDLPVLGQIGTFRVNGQTARIKYINDYT